MLRALMAVLDNPNCAQAERASARPSFFSISPWGTHNRIAGRHRRHKEPLPRGRVGARWANAVERLDRRPDARHFSAT
jgi:hypothetical protein